MKQEFKRIVKQKFGSVRRFAQYANLPEHYVYNSIRSNSVVQMNCLIEIAKIMPEYGQGDAISDQVRQSIRNAIKTRYGSQKRFSANHPEFSEMVVSRIVNGQTRRMSKKVQELIDLLEV